MILLNQNTPAPVNTLYRTFDHPLFLMTYPCIAHCMGAPRASGADIRSPPLLEYLSPYILQHCTVQGTLSSIPAYAGSLNSCFPFHSRGIYTAHSATLVKNRWIQVRQSDLISDKALWYSFLSSQFTLTPVNLIFLKSIVNNKLTGLWVNLTSEKRISRYFLWDEDTERGHILVSHNASINQFSKVTPPIESSTFCSLIEILSCRFCGGVDFPTLINEFFVSDKPAR